MSYGHIGIVVTCDTCGFCDEVSTGRYDPETAWDDVEKVVTDAGWRIDRTHLYPRHLCKECQQNPPLVKPD